MACYNPSCLGNYDFERIAFFARKRFIDGCSTMELMELAKSESEKQEIALVSMLDIGDDRIRDLKLCCSYDSQCKANDCRDMLKRLIEKELAVKGLRTEDE